MVLVVVRKLRHAIKLIGPLRDEGSLLENLFLLLKIILGTEGGDLMAQSCFREGTKRVADSCIDVSGIVDRRVLIVDSLQVFHLMLGLHVVAVHGC